MLNYQRVIDLRKLAHGLQTPVVLLLNVGHFELFFTAHCVFLAVLLGRFLPFLIVCFVLFNHSACVFKVSLFFFLGWVGGA